MSEEWDDGKLVFYQDFPTPKGVRGIRAAWRKDKTWAKITEKTVLSTLRHFYTNYDHLLRSHKYEHDFLKQRVNELILARIQGWNE